MRYIGRRQGEIPSRKRETKRGNILMHNGNPKKFWWNKRGAVLTEQCVYDIAQNDFFRKIYFANTNIWNGLNKSNLHSNLGRKRSWKHVRKSFPFVVTMSPSTDRSSFGKYSMESLSTDYERAFKTDQIGNWRNWTTQSALGNVSTWISRQKSLEPFDC